VCMRKKWIGQKKTLGALPDRKVKSDFSKEKSNLKKIFPV